MVALLTVIFSIVRLSEVRTSKTVRCATRSQIWRVALNFGGIPIVLLINYCHRESD